MLNIKEVDATVYGVQGKKVGLVEEKEDALYFAGLTSVPKGLDTRVITMLYNVAEEDKEELGYDHFIITYDMDALLSDPHTAEAIIAHEIGHIMHPVYDYSDVETSTYGELMADAHAISLGYAKPLYDFLFNARNQLHALGSDVSQMDVRLSAIMEVL